MDLQTLWAQDDVTQIATNDHYEGRGENGEEKSSPVLIAELHTGVTIPFSYNLLLVFVWPIKMSSLPGETHLRKKKNKCSTKHFRFPSGKLQWAAKPMTHRPHPPDGDGKLITKYLLLKVQWEWPQRSCWGEKGLNFVLRQLSLLSELDLLIS